MENSVRDKNSVRDNSISASGSSGEPGELFDRWRCSTRAKFAVFDPVDETHVRSVREIYAIRWPSAHGILPEAKPVRHMT